MPGRSEVWTYYFALGLSQQMMPFSEYSWIVLVYYEWRCLAVVQMIHSGVGSYVEAASLVHGATRIQTCLKPVLSAARLIWPPQAGVLLALLQKICVYDSRAIVAAMIQPCRMLKVLNPPMMSLTIAYNVDASDIRPIDRRCATYLQRLFALLTHEIHG